MGHPLIGVPPLDSHLFDSYGGRLKISLRRKMRQISNLRHPEGLRRKAVAGILFYGIKTADRVRFLFLRFLTSQAVCAVHVRTFIRSLSPQR